MFAVDGSLKRLLSNNYLFCLGTVLQQAATYISTCCCSTYLPLSPELLGILRVLPYLPTTFVNWTISAYLYSYRMYLHVSCLYSATERDMAF